MGLQSQLNDVSSDSLPIFLLALIATFISKLRHLFFNLTHTHHPVSASAAVSGLIALSARTYKHEILCEAHHNESEEDEDEEEGNKEKCIVCLSGFKDGDRVSKLMCRHVFHKPCLDGWIDQEKFSCPLCRSPLVSDCLVDRSHTRFARRLSTWFAVR